MGSLSSLSKLEIKLIFAGKMLLHLPSSTTPILNVLKDIEQILSGVQQEPPISINKAMPPIIKALIAKELIKHPDMDVNISVASCICEVLRIMAPESPYNDEEMKDFFEMVVIKFEKLSSVAGGCYTKMAKVLKLFSDVRLPVLMLDLDEVFDGLVIRLFKQFLTDADSNSSAVVHEMEKIMTVILEESEDLAHELRGLIVTSIKNDNQINSPVCLKLGKKVLMNCAAQLKSQLPDMGQDISIALYDYSKVVERICRNLSENDIMEVNETIPLSAEISKLRKVTAEIKDWCLDTVTRCQQEKKTTLICDDPPLTSKSVTNVKGKRKRNNTPLKEQAQPAVHGENLVGSRIKVWWPGDKTYYEGVVKPFNNRKKTHKVSYDDGDEECLSLNKRKWEFIKNVSSKSDCKGKEAFPLTTGISKLTKDTTLKRCQRKKETVSSEDPQMQSKSVTEVKGKQKRSNTPLKKWAQFVELGENLVGSRIKVWWPDDGMYYKGVVKSFDCIQKRHKLLYEDGQEELVDLKLEQWKLVENVSSKSDNAPEFGENLVGKRIKVWWPFYDTYYEGAVESFDSAEKKHKISYDDGDEELTCLTARLWELIENESPMSDKLRKLDFGTA